MNKDNIKTFLEQVAKTNEEIEIIKMDERNLDYDTKTKIINEKMKIAEMFSLSAIFEKNKEN